MYLFECTDYTYMYNILGLKMKKYYLQQTYNHTFNFIYLKYKIYIHLNIIHTQPTVNHKNEFILVFISSLTQYYFRILKFSEKEDSFSGPLCADTGTYIHTYVKMYVHICT